MWQDTLLNQFHDVLPGTTISLVVKDVLEIYEKRTAQAQRLIEEALLHLVPGSKELNTAIDQDVIALDPLRIKSTRTVHLNDSSAVLDIDEFGIGRIASTTSISTSPKAYEKDGGYTIENARFSMTIKDGRISSMVDKAAGREHIHAGPGATNAGLMVYEDYPLQYDAWDVEVYHLNSYKVIEFDSVEVESSASRASLKAKASFGASKVVLTVRALLRHCC